MSRALIRSSSFLVASIVACALLCFIPMSGWMADKFGARNIFRAAIGVFMGGSILCVQTFRTSVLGGFLFRAILTANAALVSLSIAAIAGFTAYTSYAAMFAVLLAGGCFRSLQFTSLNALAYADVRSGQIAAATSLESVARELAAGTGVTIGAFILQISSFVQAHQMLVVQDFRPAFIAVGLMTLASIRYSLRLPKDAGNEIVGR